LTDADDRFGERIVIRVAAAAHGRLDAGVSEALSVVRIRSALQATEFAY